MPRNIQTQSKNLFYLFFVLNNFEIYDAWTENERGPSSAYGITRPEEKSKWKAAPLIKPRENLTSKYRRRDSHQVQQGNGLLEEESSSGMEKINFEEKLEEMEKIVENLKRFFLLLVLRGRANKTLGSAH